MSVVGERVFSTHRSTVEATAAGTGAVWLTVAAVVVGAGLAVATYSGREATGLGMLLAAAVLATVVVRPQIGVLLLMTNFLVASYPTPLRGEGLLTINNLLGILLAVLLIAQFAQRPDFWMLRVRQINVYMAIGLIFVISTIIASYQFPDLRATTGRARNPIDQTLPMAQDFLNRFAFVIFIITFLARKRDLKRAIAVMMICLVMVVPSALLGYAGGRAQAGYRAVAAFSAGTNPNRLAFFCVLQIAFWWYLARTQAKTWLRLGGYAIIGSLVFTVFLTASRSGVIGLMLLFYLLARTRGGPRGGRLQLVGLALIAIAVVVTAIPQENLERLRNLNPFATQASVAGSGSTEKRVQTVEVGWKVVRDYPVFGVGLGNFREVVRQVYLDPFWRPPHNSYLWAVTEGGILCLLLYLALFAWTWRDINWLRASPAVPHEMRWIPEALAPGLILLLFFSAFADIWMSPITYMLVAVVIAFKRYVSSRRVVLA